jgi:hypothetical protein
MPGLTRASINLRRSSWFAIDGRVKPGHDEFSCREIFFKNFAHSCRHAVPPFVYWPEHAFGGEQVMPMNLLGEPVSIPALLLTSLVTACTVITTLPPTSIVGAILWTGYLGNILVTHLPIA